MKKFLLPILILFLFVFVENLYACYPTDIKDVCNVVTNFEEFDNYYPVTTCYGESFCSEGGYYIVEDNGKCIKQGGGLYLIPKTVPSEKWEFDRVHYQLMNVSEIGAIYIGRLENINYKCGGSDKIVMEETRFYNLIESGDYIGLRLQESFYGYDVRDKRGEKAYLYGYRPHTFYKTIIGNKSVICWLALFVVILIASYRVIMYLKSKRIKNDVNDGDALL